MYTTSDRPPGHNQLFNLYVILGIAVLGVLVTSIWDFGGLIQNEQTRYRTGPHGGNYKLLTAVSLIFQGKMTGLLAIAFGAVSLVYLRKTHPSSLSTTDLYMRRNMWLMGFGLINAVIFLWPHDLIFPFALTAILIFPFWRMSPKNLLIAAFVAMLIFTGKNYWDHADSKRDFKKFLAVQTIEKRISKDSATRAKLDSLWVLKTGAVKKPTDTANKKTPKLLNDSLAKAAKNDTLTKKQKSEKSNWENLVKGMKYDSSAQKDENKSMHSRYAKMFSFLLGRTQFQQASWVYKTGIWEISAFMLLGMALLGSGFFDRKWKMST
ncbi:MAG: hypothetical protein H7Y27_16060, partial [Gemmatimonadaceae bacterium]|nr:hypothetical protein [Chitinophagaceae bacterium]